MLNINKVYDFILHGSLEKYKFKNSKATDLERTNFKDTQSKIGNQHVLLSHLIKIH